MMRKKSTTGKRSAVKKDNFGTKRKRVGKGISEKKEFFGRLGFSDKGKESGSGDERKEIKDQKWKKDSKYSKNSRDFRDFRDSKNTKDTRDSGDSRDSKNTKDTRDRKRFKSERGFSEKKEYYGKKEFKDTKDSSGKKYYKEKTDFTGRKKYRAKDELTEKKRYIKKKIAPVIKDEDAAEIKFKKENADGLVRLNKFIAANGISSRRKVDEMILQERVTVNGKTINELGFRINADTDKVRVDGELVRTDTKKVYIMMNKPKGIITSVSDEKKRTTVIDLIKLNQKIYPVGRLDYNTSGLLLLTNDGELANYLMSPKNKVHKTYYTELSKPLEEKHRIKLSEGIKLDGIRTAPAKIKFLKNNDYTRLYISIYEGRNRQIHNMFEHYGYFVRELMRVEYGGLKLDGMIEGSWRYLTAEEVSKLN